MAKKKKAVSRPRGKRVAVRHRKKNPKKYTLYYILFFLMVLAAGIALSLTVLFNVETIRVEGTDKYAEGEIIENSGVKIGDNLLRINRKRNQQALIDKYPYIADAKIECRLPSDVLIRITQAEPAECVESAHGYLLIAADGRVLEEGLETAPKGYSRVVGLDPGACRAGERLPDSAAEQYQILQELTAAMEAQQLENIQLIDLTDPLDLRLLYDGRIVLELGNRLELDYKLRFAKADLAQLENQTGVLDVSTRPNAYFSPRNIFLAENWPFAPQLLADYERVILPPRADADVPTTASASESGTNG